MLRVCAKNMMGNNGIAKKNGPITHNKDLVIKPVSEQADPAHTQGWQATVRCAAGGPYELANALKPCGPLILRCI